MPKRLNGLRRVWKHPLFWLAAMVVVFFVLSTYAGISAYDNFQTHNSTNAGVVTQAVASGTFRHQAPFYESYDCWDAKARCSFLLVHDVFILYLAIPFYWLAPNTVTLFAYQSFFVALAAIPLYWLTRQVTQSRGKALLASGMYLASAPLFAAEAFSLNLESLMPVEVIGIAALWQAGRYRWALLLALVSFITFEVNPIFIFLVGVFFLLPYAYRWLRTLWGRAFARAGAGGSTSSGRRSWLSELVAPLRIREVRYGLALLVVCVVAYTVICSFMNVWGYLVLGVSAPPAHRGLAGLFYNSSALTISPLATILSSPQTAVAVEYWLIMFALVGFLPLLAPRSLVLTVPWVIYTFLGPTNPGPTMFGVQYTLVVMGGMFIGVAYGLVRVPWPASRAESKANVELKAPAAADTRGPRSRPSRNSWSRALKVGVGVFLGAVVVGNILLSPINPMLPDSGVHVGAPFELGYFYSHFDIVPGAQWAAEMLSVVPLNATIIAPSPIFPLIANYPGAVVIIPPTFVPLGSPQELARLPVNLSGGPEFVFIEKNYVKPLEKVVPSFGRNLSNPSVYGLRGYVSSSAAGTLYLYERGYRGATSAYGPA